MWKGYDKAYIRHHIVRISYFQLWRVQHGVILKWQSSSSFWRPSSISNTIKILWIMLMLKLASAESANMVQWLICSSAMSEIPGSVPIGAHLASGMAESVVWVWLINRVVDVELLSWYASSYYLANHDDRWGKISWMGFRFLCYLVSFTIFDLMNISKIRNLPILPFWKFSNKFHLRPSVWV